ncbi:hypothetical protein L0F63_007196 [Massospora cicadina]|nr:hypothetical protein L0F63_007196 [Massospora cicadina]
MYLNTPTTSATYGYQSPHPDVGSRPFNMMGQEESYLKPIRQENHLTLDDSAGIRMKRYNSLPDVTEYLDPNGNQIMNAGAMADANSMVHLGNPPREPTMANPQLDSLMAAFNQSNRKLYNKNMSTSFNPLTVPNNAPSTSSNHENYLNTPPHQSPQVPYPWQSENRSPQLFYTMPEMGTFERPKRPSDEDLMMAYPMINSPSQFMPSFKHTHPDPTATWPRPDSATAQAARDAIQAASHCPPPSDDNDPDQIPRRQHLRYPGDLYTPQWVRSNGHKKEGYCDLCSPGKWLQLKNSAYWYHKQFFHGISSVSGKFFCGPVQTRQKDPDVVEGLCHQCHQWIQMSSAKRRNSVLWFRHAHKCHVYHKPKNVYGKKD